MASAEVFDIIEQRLRAQWLETALVFENEEWPQQNTPEPFVLVEIFGDFYEQESIGGAAAEENRWREAGQLIMHVVIASGTGSRDARDKARRLFELFRGQQIGDVEFLGGSIGKSDPGEMAGQHFYMTAFVAWQRDA